MRRKAELLDIVGEEKMNPEFILEYQKSVLFALERESFLDREALEKSILRLERQALH